MRDTGHAFAPQRAVAIWLFVVAFLVGATVIVGGVTRLTESGLSMTDWRPVTGWLPPTSEAEWEEEFRKYRATPEYREINRGMSLEDYKAIFWMEYAHRILGRAIGLAFALPFLWFLVRRRLGWRLAGRLWLLLALGALQGAAGWFMVASGLVDRPSVSPYRLAFHLGLAFLIYGMLLWLAASLLKTPDYGAGETAIARPRRRAGWLLALVSVTVVAGAFVAGLNAGLYYNTFPLMDGRVVPEDYLALGPLWRNPFENPAAAQFNHRVLGIASVVAAVSFWLSARGGALTTGSRRLAAALAGMAAVQACLGVAALLTYVPVWLGAVHQAGALALFTLAVAVLHSLRQRGA